MTSVKHIFQVLFSLSAAMLAAPQALACYTVYNKANVPVYSSMSPPIDMSYQIHQRLPAVFPGGHLVFGASTDCPVIDTRVALPQLSNVAATVKPVTNRSSRTAKSKNSTVDAVKP